MKIAICGSMVFMKEMEEMQKTLQSLGHVVKTPPLAIENENGEMISAIEYHRMRQEATDDAGWVWERKEEAIHDHFHIVEWSDAILVLNITKDGIENYIGANTFLEMGLAFYLHKPIYLLNPIPKISFKEELLGMKCVVLHGKLNAILK
ncbi:MAG: hypothetical protein NUV81_04090 [bacterium]|nr:hypothetical protein [bacterium]